MLLCQTTLFWAQKWEFCSLCWEGEGYSSEALVAPESATEVPANFPSEFPFNQSFVDGNFNRKSLRGRRMSTVPDTLYISRTRQKSCGNRHQEELTNMALSDNQILKIHRFTVIFPSRTAILGYAGMPHFWTQPIVKVSNLLLRTSERISHQTYRHTGCQTLCWVGE